MTTQDLDPAERPAEALAPQTLIGERHDPVPECNRQVDRPGAGCEDPQRRFGVLGDDRLIPAPDRVERRTPDQAHRARENDRVPMGSAHHPDLEEVLNADIAGGVERAPAQAR